MTRESKMTIKAAAPTINYASCDVIIESRDNGGKWMSQGIAPVLGTVEEVIACRIARYEKFGWTLISREGNVIILRKEFP